MKTTESAEQHLPSFFIDMMHSFNIGYNILWIDRLILILSIYIYIDNIIKVIARAFTNSVHMHIL